MAKICYQYLDSPFGDLLAAANEHGLCVLSSIREPDGDWECRENPTLMMLKEQLGEYFAGNRTEFSVPLVPEGTDFQKRVWNRLREIPYGETRTYGQIAAEVGNSSASRAVGMANHYNPIMILIPCHRVIGMNGKLTGYAGGLDMKERLLKLERSI